MQVEYAFDTNDDGSPEQYLTSTTAGVTPTSLWSNVVAVRLHMLMRSTEAANAATTSPGRLRPRARLTTPRHVPVGFKCRLVIHDDAAQQHCRTPGELRCACSFPDRKLQAARHSSSRYFFCCCWRRSRLTGLRASTTNVQIVGNMQARQEVTAAAQMLLEQTVSTRRVRAQSAGRLCRGARRRRLQRRWRQRCGRGLAQKRPDACGRAQSRWSIWILQIPQDAPCFASAALINPGLLPGSGGPAGSLCADTEWHLRVRATDAQTGATITLNQGVTVRTAVVGLNTICN